MKHPDKGPRRISKSRPRARTEARILRAAAERHPDAAPNADIAAAAGYSPTSTGYTNPRSALRTKALVDYPGRDMVRAADWLFT